MAEVGVLVDDGMDVTVAPAEDEVVAPSEDDVVVSAAAVEKDGAVVIAGAAVESGRGRSIIPESEDEQESTVCTCGGSGRTTSCCGCSCGWGGFLLHLGSDGFLIHLGGASCSCRSSSLLSFFSSSPLSDSGSVLVAVAAAVVVWDRMPLVTGLALIVP